MRRVCVVIPTYNEGENIREILHRVFKNGLPNRRQYELEVLVVDDKSPDGTAAIARAFAKQHNYPVTIVSGNKVGLGEAYKRGFKHIIKEDLADIIIMMDGDLSHDPREIQPMIELVNEGTDLVVGSRYVEGGKIPGDWPIARIINSRVARFVTRYVGGLTKTIEDPAGGFRAINVESLRKSNFDDHIGGTGYVFQVGMVNHFLSHGFRVGEHPIAFNDRKFGQSKIRLKDILEYFAFSLNMRDTSPFKNHLSLYLRGMLAVTVFALVTVLAGNNALGLVWSRFLGVQAGIAVALMVTPELFTWFDGLASRNFSINRMVRALRYTALFDALLTGVVLVVSLAMSAAGLSTILSFIVATILAVVIGALYLRAVNSQIRSVRARQIEQKSLS